MDADGPPAQAANASKINNPVIIFFINISYLRFLMDAIECEMFPITFCVDSVSDGAILYEWDIMSRHSTPRDHRLQ